ncbi:MAG: hypothetical protein VX938_01560 [Myxococcota bacterium]|nr:hypothetical protein [Myxococcota bacterium]
MLRLSLILLAAGLWACSGGDSDPSTAPSGEPDVSAAPSGGGDGVVASGGEDAGGLTDSSVGSPVDVQAALPEIQVPAADVIPEAEDTGGGIGTLEVVAMPDTGGGEPAGPPVAPDPLPAGLAGQSPPADKDTGPPSLAGVLDTTGTPPKDTDLIGHWSVLWFYPAASTSG